MLKVRIQIKMRTHKHPTAQTRGHLYPDPTMTSSIFNPPPKPQPQMSNCPPLPLLLPVSQNNTAARQPHLEEEITPGGVHPEQGTRPKPGREHRAGEGGGQRSRGRSAPTAATKTQSAACNAAGTRRSVNGNISCHR